jgi:cell division transport system permease protein
MALSGAYLMRETGGNLLRNFVMTFAAIVTMAVSLSALGGVLIMRQAINKASLQWRGGVELLIFMEPHATSQQTGAIRQELTQMEGQGIKSFHYVDQRQAYQEFEQMFANQPELVKAVGPSSMPPSFRVVPSNAAMISQIGSNFSKQPGVKVVSYAQQVINNLLSHFNTMRSIALLVAIGVMLGAVALIVNTIQLAIFARRREVTVMKLVGATNWFIRIPFMLEGLFHGIVGAAAAFVVTYLARDTIASFVGSDPIAPNSTLFVTSHEALMTGLFILVVGALVGAIGSAFAVRRFLAV